MKEATSMKFYMLMWSNYMERTSHFGYFIRLKKKKTTERKEKKSKQGIKIWVPLCVGKIKQCHWNQRINSAL